MVVPKERNNITEHLGIHYNPCSASATQEFLANNAQIIIKNIQVDYSKTSDLMKTTGIVDCSRLTPLLYRSKNHLVFF